MSIFKPAQKRNVKARLALYGPSKAGKTYSALSIATGLGGKIALVDAENGSASLYADEFEFDTVGLYAPFHPGRYAEAIYTAQNEGYDVIIVDGISPAWSGPGGVLEISEKNQIKGTKWSGWAVATPAHHELVDAILACRAHLICTMRSNTEWAVGEKNKPERIGLKPDQGKNIEYEFHFLCEIDHTHSMRVEARGEFAGTAVDAGKESAVAFGRSVGEWLTKDAVSLSTAEQNERVVELGRELKERLGEDAAKDAYRVERDKAGGDAQHSLTEEQAVLVIAALENRLEDSAAEASPTDAAERAAVEPVAQGSGGSSVPTAAPPNKVRAAEVTGISSAARITSEQRKTLEKLRTELVGLVGGVRADESWFELLEIHEAHDLDGLSKDAAVEMEKALRLDVKSAANFEIPESIQQKLTEKAS